MAVLTFSLKFTVIVKLLLGVPGSITTLLTVGAVISKIIVALAVADVDPAIFITTIEIVLVPSLPFKVRV